MWIVVELEVGKAEGYPLYTLELLRCYHISDNGSFSDSTLHSLARGLEEQSEE